MAKPMSKQVRARLWRADLLLALRNRMRSILGAEGLLSSPGMPISDGSVIDFALTVADRTLSEDTILIHHSRFLRAMNDVLNRHIESMAKMSPEEREALVETLVTAQVATSSVDPGSPLIAVKLAPREKLKVPPRLEQERF